MKILITGGTGFIGKNLALALAKRPETEIHIFSHKDSDITDKKEVSRIVRHILPHWIFHLAADIRRSREKNLYQELFQVNTQGTLNLLSVAQENGVEAFISVGTFEEYGNAPVPFDENGVIKPVSPYGISKAAATLLTAAYGRSLIPSAVLRFPIVFGQGQEQESFLSKMKEAIISGNPFPMSSGDQTRDFLYVDDAVEALIQTAEKIKACSGEIINICWGREISIKEAINTIKKVTKKDGFAELGATPYSSNEQMRYAGQNQKMKSMLDFEPKVTFEEGIIKMFL